MIFPQLTGASAALAAGEPARERSATLCLGGWARFTGTGGARSEGGGSSEDIGGAGAITGGSAGGEPARAPGKYLNVMRVPLVLDAELQERDDHGEWNEHSRTNQQGSVAKARVSERLQDDTQVALARRHDIHLRFPGAQRERRNP